MAGKLKLVLQNLPLERRSHLLLYLKVFMFGAALFLAALDGFSWFDILFFGFVSVLLYSRPLFEHYITGYAFLILLPVSVIGMKILSGSFLFIPGIILFSLIFYLVLGVKDLLFIKRSRLHYLAALLLFYTIFIEFFLADKSEWFLLKYGLVILAAFLLFREWLKIISTFSFPARERLAAALAALLVAQVLWAVALLPIGFISSANFMLLFVFILADFLFKHFTGGISKEFIIQRLVLFALLATLIFWTSSWTLIK